MRKALVAAIAASALVVGSCSGGSGVGVDEVKNEMATWPDQLINGDIRCMAEELAGSLGLSDDEWSELRSGAEAFKEWRESGGGGSPELPDSSTYEEAVDKLQAAEKICSS